jgi:hypothetical protein
MTQTSSAPRQVQVVVAFLAVRDLEGVAYPATRQGWKVPRGTPPCTIAALHVPKHNRPFITVHKPIHRQATAQTDRQAGRQAGGYACRR